MNNSKGNVSISLIIPVYNVEDFLEKALNSAANQTIKDYEVIVVNDGSTDHSLEIIQTFIERYDNFHLINQENVGLGEARNIGLKMATGEYIVFMDSDDFVEPTYLEDLYNACVQNNADISYCAHYIYFPKRNIKFYMPMTCRKTVFNKKPALRRLIRDVTIHYFAWNKCYKRSLFIDNDIKFENIYFEDIATTPKLFFYAEKVAILSKALYNYNKREGSILNSMNEKKINDYIKAYAINRNFLEKNSVFQDYKLSFVLLGYRMMLCNFYSIFRIHFINRSFRGMLKNFESSNKSISYFQGPHFEIFNGNPILPSPIKIPKKRKSKKEGGSMVL